MATAGNFSPENEYFCRYFRLVNETAAKPLRKILENTAASRHLTVDAFVFSYKSTMQILLTRGIIQKHQFNNMYPKTGTFCIENLDISLLCVLLKNTCNVSPNGKAAYEDIRKYRNELCHNPIIALQRLDYYSKFSNVHSTIKTLLQECQDATFDAEIENEIKNIDKSPVSVSPVLNSFKEFLFKQESKTAAIIADRIRQLEISMTDIYSYTDHKIRDLYATVERQPFLTAKAVQRILNEDTRRKEVNQMIETLQEQTEEVLKRKSEYVLTQQFLEAENMLLSSGSVVISGGAGEGKTYAAFEILRRNGQENNCIQIHSPDDVRFVDPRIFDFVFIDDIFGNYEVDESKLQSWIQVMEQLQHLVNVKAVHLIIATRELVIRECKEELEKFPIFKNRLSLSSRFLSQEEKTEILKTILTDKKKQCSHEEIQRCVSTFSSDLGFPYTCVLFASDETFFQEGASFFKHNPFINLGGLTELHDCKQIALLYLWIKDATRPVALNRTTENDAILKRLSSMLSYEHAIDQLYDQINNQCKIMDGIFVIAGPHGYQFSHNAVYQSIGFNFARKGHYDFILEYSNLAFFMEAISVTEDHYQSDRVFIRNEHYQNLVDRIIVEVTERNHGREMAMHSCLSKEVLCLLTKTLNKGKKIKRFFFSGIKSESADNEFCRSNAFLSYFLESCAAESCTLLKQLRDLLSCSKKFQHKKNKVCEICRVYSEAFRGACRGGNIDALKMLDFVKCNSCILRDAAYSGNVLMYEYIMKTQDLKKDVENEKQALYIAIEKKDLEMYDFIRQKGCLPDSTCLIMASKLRSSKVLVHIIRDMHVADVLRDDENLKYTKSTIFSIDVLETLFLVGMCPTKEDIVRAMTTDNKTMELILWDLKYKVKRKHCSHNVIKLWRDIIEDPDLNEKLEEIGLLETTTYLDRQISKGHFENVNQIIQHLQRNNDWTTDAYYAVNLLNISLPDRTDIFRLLLNIGIIPRYTTLYKSVATKDINIVKMTVNKMIENGKFDPSNRGSKQALLQSTLSCDIYNYLIDQGVVPNAYHLLYIVESDIDASVKTEAINNVYMMAERCNVTLNFDTNVIQLALLGAFDDVDVYTCLLRDPFRLPSSFLPVITSRGSITQVERFIENLKSHEDWPPSFDATHLSLQRSFYNPGIFEILMKEECAKSNNDQQRLLVYKILFECRMHSFHKIKDYISILKNCKLWSPNDIVLKCSLLESSDDQATCELFRQNGVVSDDILDAAWETGNYMMQSYITAYLSGKGQTINFENYKEEIIKSLSCFPHLCTDNLLSRAVEVSDISVVARILDNLHSANPYFANSEKASHILEHCSERLDIYASLLEKGFTPTTQCLLSVVKCGSYEVFYDTIKHFCNFDTVTEGLARQLVQESLKRDNSHFYVTLAQHGITGKFEDIVYALNEDNIPICHLIVNDIQNDFANKCPEGIDVIILKCFPLYEVMYNKGLQITSSVLLKLTNLYMQGQISLSNILSVLDGYFSRKHWSFEDANLSKIYQLSKSNEDLFSYLDLHFQSEKESYLLTCLMSRDKEAMKQYLDNDICNAKRVLPKVLRNSAVSRKRLDKGCIQLMKEWIENTECDPSLKILSSVLYSDTEHTLQIIYELSEKEKATLDFKVLETAIEEAIYNKKTGLYCSIVKEYRVIPTTYCLLYSIQHNNDTCFNITLKKLPKEKKTCRDPYFKTSLALCCQKLYINKFKSLLSECKSCDTEILYEAVLSKNELLFKLVHENLITHDRWDFSLTDYMIASALVEADDKSSIRNEIETYYDDIFCPKVSSNYAHIRDDSITEYQWVKEGQQMERPTLTTADVESQSEDFYEEIDSFILHENAYRSLHHVDQDQI